MVDPQALQIELLKRLKTGSRQKRASTSVGVRRPIAKRQNRPVLAQYKPTVERNLVAGRKMPILAAFSTHDESQQASSDKVTVAP
jgi:hypothetical protein